MAIDPQRPLAKGLINTPSDPDANEKAIELAKNQARGKEDAKKINEGNKPVTSPVPRNNPRRSIYNFKPKAMSQKNAIHFFTDLEGCNPFNGGIAAKLGELGITTEDGIITDVPEGDKVVYAGDMLDKYMWELPNVITMLRMHDGGKATMIAGNRDSNKLRLLDELKIVGEELTINKLLATSESLAEHANAIKNNPENYKFIQFDEEKTTARFKTWADPMAEHATLEDVDVGSAKKRLNKMIAGWMGIQPVDNLITNRIADAKKYFVISKLEKDAEAIFVCLYYTILAGGYGGVDPNKNWNDDVTHKDLNGLYLHYLKRCKLMSIEEVGGATILVAHGGFPVKLFGPSDAYMEELGTSECHTGKTLRDVVDMINTKMEKDVTSIVDGTADDKKVQDIINYYVAMGGPLRNEAKWCSQAPMVNNDMINMPHKNIPNEKLELYDKLWTTRYISNACSIGDAMYAVTDKPSEGSKAVDFAVFGHQPRGNAPSVYRSAKDEEGRSTTYVNLDVSNSNDNKGALGNTSRYDTCAVLTVRSKGDFEVNGQCYHKTGDNSYDLISYTNDHKDYLNYPPLEVEVADKKILSFFRYQYDQKPVLSYTGPGFNIQNDDSSYNEKLLDTKEVTLARVRNDAENKLQEAHDKYNVGKNNHWTIVKNNVVQKEDVFDKITALVKPANVVFDNGTGTPNGPIGQMGGRKISLNVSTGVLVFVTVVASLFGASV